MAVLSEQIDLGQTAFEHVDLLDGERAETTLNLRDEPKRSRGAATDVLVLTDRRLIHLADDGRSRQAVFVWLADVIAVRVGTERPGGIGGYVWGALSIIAAILVWSVWGPAGAGRGRGVRACLPWARTSFGNASVRRPSSRWPSARARRRWR